MSQVKKPNLIVIVGPTGSGKSDLAIFLAKKLPHYRGFASIMNGVEIVNADSRMIYQGMEIGTAVPTPIQRRSNAKNKLYDLVLDRDLSHTPWRIAGIPHWLIGFQPIDQVYTLAQYQRDAFRVIDDIIERGKLPILVGGTGLYIRAVTENLAIPNVAPNIRLRKKLEKLPLTVLWRRLIKLDPQAAKFVQKDNPRRVIRALEVCLETGKKFSELRQKNPPRYRTLTLGLKIPFTKLYPRLDARVHHQLRAGLISETKRLHPSFVRSLAPHTKTSLPPALGGFVYHEVIEYLNGKYDRIEMIRRIQFANHAYARRQMTWFRKYGHVRWIKNKNEAQSLVKKFLLATWS